MTYPADYTTPAQAAKNWIKQERKFFIEHLADELGSAKAAQAAWRKIKAEARNTHIEEMTDKSPEDRYALALEARMEELYEDADELK